MSRMADQTNLVDRIYSKQMFSKEASKAVGLQSDLTDSDLSVLLKFLARDKGVLVYDDVVSIWQVSGRGSTNICDRLSSSRVPTSRYLL